MNFNLDSLIGNKVCPVITKYLLLSLMNFNLDSLIGYKVCPVITKYLLLSLMNIRHKYGCV